MWPVRVEPAVLSHLRGQGVERERVDRNELASFLWWSWSQVLKMKVLTCRKPCWKHCWSMLCEVVSMGTSLHTHTRTHTHTHTYIHTHVHTHTHTHTGGIVLLALGVLTPWFYYIPETSLAAIIITAVLHMVDLKMPLAVWKISSGLRWLISEYHCRHACVPIRIVFSMGP